MKINVSIFAWIVLKNPEFKLIHPLLYRMIDNFIGNKSALQQILDFKLEMKLDGYYGPPDDADLSKNPFYGIGMYEFAKRFDEIMTYFYKKRKNKKQLYEHIMSQREKIFISCVPVYSAVLREVYITNEEYSYTKIDKNYNALYGNVTRLNEEKTVKNYNIAKINKNLYKAQTNLNKAWELIFTSINENEGLIRRNVLGGRMNFSSRCVIIPDATLKSYEIKIPYVCFVEMWRPDIINILVKLDGISYSKALERWFDGYRAFDNKIYSIIQYILKHDKGKTYILLNRNPELCGAYIRNDI